MPSYGGNYSRPTMPEGRADGTPMMPRAQFWFTGQTAAGSQWDGHASR